MPPASASTALPVRAFQWDLARQVERLPFLLRLLPRYADWGYQELYLHLEDAVVYPGLPEVARRDAYSHAQLARLVETAARHGIATVPIVNLLGHTQYLIKTPGLRDLNELRAPDGSPLPAGQLCPLHPRTLDTADRLIRDVLPFCTAGKIHLGLDESFSLGRCPRCRDEIARRGLSYHFSEYVRRLHALAAARGLRAGIWADMLNLIPAAIARLPRGLAAYDWYYYPFARAPRVELHNFAERDLAPALRARGIDYYGCPMNGAFRHELLPLFRDRLANLRSWWTRCRRTQASGFLVTSWEPFRLAFELAVVVDAAAASLWLDAPALAANDERMLARGFARLFGRKNSLPSARAALACDARAFTGYARWEINDRWDVAAPRKTKPETQRRNPPKASTASLQTPHAAPRAALPAPLAASIAFLDYLETRDAFIAACQQTVFALRQMASPDLPASRRTWQSTLRAATPSARGFAAAVRQARRAARLMWTRTRDPRTRSQNELILDADQARLRAWRDWLRAVRRDPARVHEATPVCGRWQLTFIVHNHAPALQKIVVQQRWPDGAWLDLHSRFTIEFRAEAARPRAALARPFSVPVDDPRLPLRIALRGLGQVAIGRPELTSGPAMLLPRGWPRRLRRRLGRPAPRAGFPKLDWTANNAIISLPFM
ncbi:family 20 glycosylhydrolase [Termitidicoccus mucosus]|uniref:Glycoside hydrolase family 20 n=1 Tax=Termitidicoccus mucosus TaxID=1184151 RepID=A0A178IEU6_9BACT|nr:glycoside hydrolase family 20 [Opitutaceae bacterium TSB47]